MKRYLSGALTSAIITIMLVATVAIGSQTYNADTFNLITGWDTLMQRMEDNFAALKSNFSGSTSPSNPVEGMQYAESDANKLWLYGGTGWIEMFDWDTMTWNIGTGTITAAHISNSAREPTIVTSQNIYPNYVQAPSGYFTSLTVVNDFLPCPMSLASAVGSNITHTGSTWTTVATIQVYLPPGATTMTMASYLHNTAGGNRAAMRFNISTIYSGENSLYGTAWTWLRNASATVSSLSAGYYTVNLQMWTQSAGMTLTCDAFNIWVQ